jgi:hypothetical protein
MGVSSPGEEHPDSDSHGDVGVNADVDDISLMTWECGNGHAARNECSSDQQEPLPNRRWDTTVVGA